MKGIWKVLNLADFESHGLMVSQNGYRHTLCEPSRCYFQLLATEKCLAGTFLVLSVPLFVLFSEV